MLARYIWHGLKDCVWLASIGTYRSPWSSIGHSVNRLEYIESWLQLRDDER